MNHTLEEVKNGQLSGYKRLNLSVNLQAWPKEINALADHLEVLNLSHNALRSLPDDLAQFRQLKVLFCSYNQLREIPEVLKELPLLHTIGLRANQIESFKTENLPASLRALILTENRLQALPAQWSNLPELRKLMLSGNHLQTLPDGLQHCHKLEMLRVAANDLQQWPTVIKQMPSLAWLAIAGNSCTIVPKNLAPIDRIDWSELSILQCVGEGSSGMIYEAYHQKYGQVAVKVFKGEMGSDGLPYNEMLANRALCSHPRTVATLAEIQGHPQQCSALVLRWLDVNLQPIAKPPSLESCTRDWYVSDQRDVSNVRELLQSVLAAISHVHNCGLIHGDLYGHNVLADDLGHAILTDLGAAAFYPAAMRQEIEAIEVRAFGILMQELCAHLKTDIGTWNALIAACLQTKPHMRPTWKTLQHEIQVGGPLN